MWILFQPRHNAVFCCFLASSTATLSDLFKSAFRQFANLKSANSVYDRPQVSLTRSNDHATRSAQKKEPKTIPNACKALRHDMNNNTQQSRFRVYVSARNCIPQAPHPPLEHPAHIDIPMSICCFTNKFLLFESQGNTHSSASLSQQACLQGRWVSATSTNPQTIRRQSYRRINFLRLRQWLPLLVSLSF